MSQGPADPTAGVAGAVPGAGGQQPSEEQIRAYLAQLRQAAPDELVAQAFSVLASGAEVKLGRRDARLLIDAAAALAEAVDERVEADLEKQMTTALNQLRVAQVDAEKQLAKLRDEGRLPPEEEGELPADAGETEVPEDVAAAAEEARQAAQQGDQPGPADQDRSSDAASRLWIPGR
jgi:hypothetical protein